MKFFLFALWLTLATCANLLAPSARAAEIVDLGNCNFKISGVLESGDSTIFSQTVGVNCTYSTLHLDSPGGSVTEALKIVMLYDRTSTVIDQGSQCLSACALLFMAGRVCAGSPFYCAPSRAMDKTAVLGFHAPFLKETTSDELVPLNLSFSAALNTFSSIQDTFSQLSAEVRQTGYDKEIIPLDLMAKIFSTPPDKFFYIENNDQFFAFDISLLDADIISGNYTLKNSNLENMCYNFIYSEMRGWNYSTFGFNDYENASSDTRNSVKEFVTRSVDPKFLPPEFSSLKIDEYFIRFEYLNMGPLVSGWCRVTPDLWSRSGYFDVRFYQEHGEPNLGVSIDNIFSDSPVVQGSLSVFSGRMHYSMGWRLRTPVKDIAAPGSGDPAAIDTVRGYFRSLDRRLPGSHNLSAADYWVSNKRKAVVALISNICEAEVGGIHSIQPDAAKSKVFLTSRVRACNQDAFEEYKIVVDLLKERDEWKIAAIRSASW